MREELKVDVGNLKRIDGFPRRNEIENEKQMFGWFCFPYVAIPVSIGGSREELFLMYQNRGESLAGIYYGSYGEIYHVYQIKVHCRDLDVMAKRLFELGGFFLVEK